jgi:hypothetical protein
MDRKYQISKWFSDKCCNVSLMKTKFKQWWSAMSTNNYLSFQIYFICLLVVFCFTVIISCFITLTLRSVASLLAEPSNKDIMIGTTSSRISDQLRDIYSICRCCWNLPTYGFGTGVSRRVPLVEQELLPLPEHLNSPLSFSVVRVVQALGYQINWEIYTPSVGAAGIYLHMNEINSFVVTSRS